MVNMAVEDTFNGAKTGLTLLFAYLNMVGQEIGMERAMALDTKMCEAMGAAQGQMVRQQAGTEEFDTKAASQLLLGSIEKGLGILSETTEEGPQRVVVKIGRCPVYEAAQALGMDAEAIEATCRAGSIRFMDTMAKQFDPNLSYQLTRFRSAADDYCEEAIAVA
jgi:predicted ArsR family transcriptional regulator